MFGSIVGGNSLSLGAVNETAQSPELSLETGKAYEFSIYARTWPSASGTVSIDLTDATNSINTNIGTIALGGTDTIFEKFFFQQIIANTQDDYLVEINKTSSGFVLLDLFEVKEIPAPVTPVVSSAWNPCDSLVTLNINLVDGSTYTVDWGDGSVIETVTASSPTHAYTIGSTNTVTVTATNILGFQDNTTVVEALALTAPTAVFTYTQNDASINVVSSETTSCNTYTWDFGDGSATTTGTSASHTYTSAGTYTISLTADNDAGQNTTSQTVDIIISINEIDFVNGINLFPNPVKDVLNVSFELKNAQNVEISLISIDGKNISSVSKRASAIDEKINISDLATGIYILNITTEEGKYTTNVLVK